MKLHNEELHHWYCLLNILRVIECIGKRGGACSTCGWKKYTQSSDRKPERKTLFGRPRHRWESNIEMYLREIGCESVECSHVAKGTNIWRAVVNRVMNLHAL